MKEPRDPSYHIMSIIAERVSTNPVVSVFPESTADIKKKNAKTTLAWYFELASYWKVKKNQRTDGMI